MKRSAFASLTGVSKQMVSKHEAAGRIVFAAPDQVDATASLALLEGHLDADKWHRAQAVLTGAPAAGQRAQARPVGGAKAQKEEIERDLKLVELGQATHALVLASEVADAAADAVALLRETVHNAKREAAARICATFGIPAERSAALARALGDEWERALGRFATAAGALAHPQAEDAAAHDAAPAQADATAQQPASANA